ncbi:MAG: hypothetical protein ACREV8_15170 [Gammaproteobacteria bacterium]
MVRRTDRPLQIVRVSFETTRFSAHHLIEAYTALVPLVRRQPLRAANTKTGPPRGAAMTTKRRGGEA